MEKARCIVIMPTGHDEDLFNDHATQFHFSRRVKEYQGISPKIESGAVSFETVCAGFCQS
jgi:hypothetical protein